MSVENVMEINPQVEIFLEQSGKCFLFFYLLFFAFIGQYVEADRKRGERGVRLLNIQY